MRSVSCGHIEKVGIARPERLPKHPACFADLTDFDIFALPKDKPLIKELVSITVQPEIKSPHIIKTPESSSFEGQISDGCSLILEMILKLSIRYISDADVHNVHVLYLDSTVKNICIALPTQCYQPSIDKYYDTLRLNLDREITIRPYIEDIHCLLKNPETLYVSYAFFINVLFGKVQVLQFYL